MEVALGSATPPDESHTNISKYEPPTEERKGRKYEGKDRITYGPYLEEMFFNNELEYYFTAPKTNQQLRYQFLLDHKSNYTLKQRFKSYKETIGNYRSKYNRRMLYSTQGPVYLLSLDYNDAGYIVIDGKQYYKHLTFKQAYERCLEFKIADPRFILPDKIELLRDRKNSDDISWSDWSVPPESFIKQLQTKLRVDNLYNSIQFPQFCTLEETMDAP